MKYDYKVRMEEEEKERKGKKREEKERNENSRKEESRREKRSSMALSGLEGLIVTEQLIIGIKKWRYGAYSLLFIKLSEEMHLQTVAIVLVSCFYSIRSFGIIHVDILYYQTMGIHRVMLVINYFKTRCCISIQALPCD